MWPFIQFCYLWPSSVTLSICQGYLQFYYLMYLMLYVGTNYEEVCRFNRNGDIVNCSENDISMTSSPIRFLRHSNTTLPRAYLISFGSNIRERSSTVWKSILENYVETMDIASLWPWPSTNDYQSWIHCSKQPFSENCIQISSSDRLEFCSLTDRQTHRQTNCSEKIATKT